MIDQLDLSGKEKNKIWEEILKINQSVMKKDWDVEIFKKERDLRHQETIELKKQIDELNELQISLKEKLDLVQKEIFQKNLIIEEITKCWKDDLTLLSKLKEDLE